MDDDASTYRAPASPLPAFRYFSLPASPVAPPPNPLWLTQESCAFKATTGVVLGAGVGAMMGLFFGILGADPSVPVGPGGRAIPAAPLAHQVRVAWRALGDKALWYTKSFAVITALFSGCDCLFEKARGRHDAINGSLSGCATGAVLAAKQGPQAACLGCVGFAAFSVAVDAPVTVAAAATLGVTTPHTPPTSQSRSPQLRCRSQLLLRPAVAALRACSSMRKTVRDSWLGLR